MKKWSLYIGSYAGIKVFFHWTFWIIIAWIFLMHFLMGHGWLEVLNGTEFILALFGCVVLHEFGHALKAKKYGIHTSDITLYPIGGVASLSKMPDKPAQELAVALAGPAVNVVIAGAVYLWLKAIRGLLPISEMEHMSGDNFWFNLMVANAILAIFNLIPAFSMDGGRILRAILAFNMNKVKATNIAARIGQVLAIVFVFLGFFTNFWLVFIGFFIYLGAGDEVTNEQQKASFMGLKAKDVMITRLPVLSSNMELGEAVKDALASQDRLFFVESEGCITGLINFKELLDAINYSHEKSIAEIIDYGVTNMEEHAVPNTAVMLMNSPQKVLAVTYRGLSQQHIEEILSVQDQLKKQSVLQKQ